MMKQSDNFITLGRAIFAFPITMWAGALAWLPASIIFVRQIPSALAPGPGDLPHFAVILFFELLWAPIGALLFSPHVLPFYILGLLVGRRLRISNLLYFLLLGCVFSFSLNFFVSRGKPHASYVVMFPVDLSVGFVSGFACWASLYLTRRWFLHQSVVTVR